MEIIITYENRTPCGRFDYCAKFDGYEPGDHIGYGPTPEAATDDLMQSVEMLSA